MAIDQKLKETAKSHLTSNQLRQLSFVVPDLFDKDFMMLHVVSRPMAFQHKFYPFVVDLDVKVNAEIVASTHPEYASGTIENPSAYINSFNDQGYSVILLPFTSVREAAYSPDWYGQEAVDPLVVAESSMRGNELLLHSFYANAAKLIEGARLGYGHFGLDKLNPAVCRRNVPFVFLQKGNEKRTWRCIEKFEDGPYYNPRDVKNDNMIL